MAKLKVGVFGAGRGRTMISVLQNHPDAELVAVCDKYRPLLDEVGKAASEKGLNVALYERFDDFFEHDMDAVVMANYANEHEPFGVRLLKSGRHILSEVLPCATMAQAVELIETVEQTGKVYAYAENYCYMDHTFEMWRRYEKGDIGEIMYGEGEYIHDCSVIWPEITYGERDHWRNAMYPTFYCTHSIGPLMTISGKRPVSVTGFATNHNDTVPPLGIKMGERAGIEMVTLENGAVLKSVHGHLKRMYDSVNYEVYGTKGSMETQRFRPSYGQDKPNELQVYLEGAHTGEGTYERYVPEKVIDKEAAESYASHGGSDFYPTHFFIRKILGDPIAEKYSIDVYRAVDMGICGILAYRSILNGGIPVKVPDLRDKAQRDAYRNDNACTIPSVAKEQLWPCAPEGDHQYSDEVFKHVEQLWKNKEKP